MIPCPDPKVCGVKRHHNLSNCRAVMSKGVKKEVPVPSSLDVASPEEQERRDHYASGGTIEITRHSNGRVASESWRDANGFGSRKNGPFFRKWDIEGNLVREEWTDDPHGLLSREDDEPAVTEWHSNGQLKSLQWWWGGALHRRDGPAKIWWNSSGVKVLEEWSIDYDTHREDGPAVTRWDADGSLHEEEFWREGNMLDVEHSLDIRIKWFRKNNPEFDDMPDEWVIEYLKGQRS